MSILDGPNDPAARGLPNEYGLDDIPMIVQDRAFDDSGDMDTGTTGDTLSIVRWTTPPYGGGATNG
jgi:hypothetical protein